MKDQQDKVVWARHHRHSIWDAFDFDRTIVNEIQQHFKVLLNFKLNNCQYLLEITVDKKIYEQKNVMVTFFYFMFV